MRRDGKISMPLIGDVQAAGLRAERLAAQLGQALSELINKPDVTVTVTQVNSKTFSITGGVNRPGKYPLVVSTTVFEALSAAGGFREFANKKDIIIIHADSKSQSHFNWNDFIKGKKRELNIELKNGDTIIVKE
jgi:polysaccharide export outer membrane protein